MSRCIHTTAWSSKRTCMHHWKSLPDHQEENTVTNAGRHTTIPSSDTQPCLHCRYLFYRMINARRHTGNVFILGHASVYLTGNYYQIIPRTPANAQTTAWSSDKQVSTLPFLVGGLSGSQLVNARRDTDNHFTVGHTSIYSTVTDQSMKFKAANARR